LQLAIALEPSIRIHIISSILTLIHVSLRRTVKSHYWSTVIYHWSRCLSLLVLDQLQFKLLRHGTNTYRYTHVINSSHIFPHVHVQNQKLLIHQL